MNTLIVYDSVHGNTKLIAEEIWRQFDPETTAAIPVSKMDKVDLSQVDLLIVGSPTYGGQATKPLQTWLSSLAPYDITGKKVATFDTRLYEKEQKFLLRLLMKVIDYAAPKMEKVLVEKGSISLIRPQGFFVIAKEGPLKSNEQARAVTWAQEINTRFRNG